LFAFLTTRFDELRDLWPTAYVESRVPDPFGVSASYSLCSLAANCCAPLSQTSSYDAFGNINKSGSMSCQPTHNPATNRMSALPEFTLTHDNNGNVKSDSSHQYTPGRGNGPITIDSVGPTYDALGRMVEQNRSGVYTQIVYGASWC
jgi:hypothetical protein